VPFVFLKLC